MISDTTLLTLEIALLAVLMIMQCFRINKCMLTMKSQESVIHLLEEEMDEIQREQDLIYSWARDSDVVIAGINDENSRRKALQA